MSSQNPPDLSEASGDKPRWARRKEARRGELVQAALELFVERGFAATRTDDVAARAGVAKGTMYLYFTNKEDLFRAVVHEAIVPTITEGGDLVRNFEGHTADLLAEVMWRWWKTVGESPAAGIVKLVMSEAGNFPEITRLYYEDVILPAHQLLHGLLARGIERGEFRPIDIEMTTQALVAPMVMLMMWKQSIGPCAQVPLPDPHRYLNHVLDLALRGLLTEPYARLHGRPDDQAPC